MSIRWSDIFGGQASTTTTTTTTTTQAGSASTSMVPLIGQPGSYPQGGYYSGSVAGIYTGTTAAAMFPPPLTAEETTELDALTKSHEADVKAMKISEFKKVPSLMRQTVVDSIYWSQRAHDIGSLTAPEPQRLTELKNKKQYNSYLTHQAYTVGTGTAWTSPFGYSGPFVIPSGLTAEDLKKAHLEATVEEEMLNVDIKEENRT